MKASYGFGISPAQVRATKLAEAQTIKKVSFIDQVLNKLVK